MRRGVLVVALVGGLAAGAACNKSRAAGPSGEPLATPIAFHEPVLGKLKDGGFAPGKFQPTAADPYGAKECVRGEVDRLEVLLCKYPTPEAAKQARPKLTAFGRGAVSGAARTAGPTAIVVADRQQVDLPGKRMKRLLRTFAAEPKAEGPAAPADVSAAK